MRHQVLADEQGQMFMSSCSVETTFTVYSDFGRWRLPPRTKWLRPVLVVPVRQGRARDGVRGALPRWLAVREWLLDGCETTRV